MADELIEIADSEVDDKHDQDRMMRVRQWVTAKQLPHRYATMAAMSAPPPPEPLRSIEDAKVINGMPVRDPLMEAHENFLRALQEQEKKF